MDTDQSLFPELDPDGGTAKSKPGGTEAANAESGSDSVMRTAADEPAELERTAAAIPLAHRLRPDSFDDFVGQRHVVGLDKPLRRAIEAGSIGSIVLWGPPGCGKTTLAKLIARHTDRHFETFSAVTEGVPRVREIIAAAKQRLETERRGTILFCDEIHRFNKAQQDAFLPHVEDGAITLVGATTENPSFELNSALLSRVRVFVLEPLAPDDLSEIVRRAARMLSGRSLLSAEAVDLLATQADGDARRALNAVEAVWRHLAADDVTETEVSADVVADVLERRVARFDKSGEEHFNQISALHKAVRGSDVEGALYWLARMLSAGEDPMYLLRRIVRMAAEDVGLTDPRALSISLAAKDAYHFLGPPEGELAIAEAVIYLATAPKSNRVYQAWNQATSAAREYPAEPVPLAVRNAPTRLMRELGYGKGYRYDHDEGGFAAGQRYLPEALSDVTWYEPTEFGFEKTLGERLDWWRKLKQAVADE